MDSKTKTIIIVSSALVGIGGMLYLASQYKPSVTVIAGQEVKNDKGILEAIAVFFSPISNLFGTKKT